MKNITWAPNHQRLLGRLQILKSACDCPGSSGEALRLKLGPWVTQQSWHPRCLKATL